MDLGLWFWEGMTPFRHGYVRVGGRGAPGPGVLPGSEGWEGSEFQG